MRNHPGHRHEPELNEAAKIAVLQLRELVTIRMLLGRILRAVSHATPVRTPTSSTARFGPILLERT